MTCCPKAVCIHDLEGYLPSLERRREILVKNQLLEKLLTEWTQKIAQQIYFLIANLPRRGSIDRSDSCWSRDS